MPTRMSKSQLIDKIATTTELAKRDVKQASIGGHRRDGYRGYPLQRRRCHRPR